LPFAKIFLWRVHVPGHPLTDIGHGQLAS